MSSSLDSSTRPLRLYTNFYWHFGCPLSVIAHSAARQFHIFATCCKQILHIKIHRLMKFVMSFRQIYRAPAERSNRIPNNKKLLNVAIDWFIFNFVLSHSALTLHKMCIYHHCGLLRWSLWCHDSGFDQWSSILTAEPLSLSRTSSCSSRLCCVFINWALLRNIFVIFLVASRSFFLYSI